MTDQISPELKERIRQQLHLAHKSQYGIIRELTEEGFSETSARGLVDEIAAEVYEAPSAEIRAERREERRHRNQQKNYQSTITIGLFIAIVGAILLLSDSLRPGIVNDLHDQGIPVDILILIGGLLYVGYGLYRWLHERNLTS